MSTAYAAGIAALLHGFNPTLNHVELIDVVIAGMSEKWSLDKKGRGFDERLALAADAYFSSLKSDMAAETEDDDADTRNRLLAKKRKGK